MTVVLRLKNCMVGRLSNQEMSSSLLRDKSVLKRDFSAFEPTFSQTQVTPDQILSRCLSR